jgi:hypothetical protein
VISGQVKNVHLSRVVHGADEKDVVTSGVKLGLKTPLNFKLNLKAVFVKAGEGNCYIHAEQNI